MSGEDYLPQIMRKISEAEDPRDVIVMINLLANARAKEHPSAFPEANAEFAAAIICILLEPLKPPDYAKKARSYRISFKGIYRSNVLQRRFRKSFSKDLLRATGIKSAIRLGFDALFVSQSERGGANPRAKRRT